MPDAVALVPRWLSVLREAPVLFVVVVIVSFGVGWWQKWVLDKGKIDGLDKEVKVKQAQVAAITQTLKYADERQKDCASIIVQLRNVTDQLKSEIETGVPAVEITKTIGEVQSSLARLNEANRAISVAIQNSTATLGGNVGMFSV